MVAILYPRRLRELLDVDQPGGIGLPDQGVPVLHSSNSSFVIQTIAGGGGGSFSLGASNLGNTLGQTGVTGSRVVLAGIGNLTLSQLTDGNGGTISISAGTAGAGFSAGVSGGNTAGDTGATGTRLVFAGGQSVTLSQATDANGGTITIDGASTSQSVQTQNRFNLTLSGNTAGVMAEVSSGTVTLAGGANITLSQNGNAITISGAAGGAETQTAISGVAASNTTYTSGTVTFTGVGGGVTVSSNTGQRIDISVAAPVAQTNQAGSLYAIGNTTSSTSGTWDARTLSISGAGIVSVAATNSGFKISATQSNQAGSVYAVGNTTSSSSGTYDARTLSLRGDGIISIAATNSGFRISATESVQTQNLHNVTLSGNTAGAMAQISSGTMTLAGGNNITLSQAGNAVTISGANVGGAQTGISSIVASNTTYTSGQVEFTGSGIVTVRSSANQRVVIDASQSVQTQSLFSAGVSNLGNTAGDTGVSGTRMVLAGTNGITLSQSTNANGNTVTISGATQTVQTQNMVAVTLSGNTSGAQALISSGTLTLAGGNNITVSQAGNAVTISGPNVGGAQTGISGLANSETTYTSGSVTFSALGAITIRSTTGQHFQFSVNSQTVQTQSLFSAGVSTGGNTAGDTGITGTRLVFVGSNNITLSQATAAAGGTVTISGPTTVAQTNQSGGAYAVGNTYSSSSGTFDARTLSIRGDGIISVAATNSGWRISASQSVQAETQTFVGGLAASNTTYTSGTVTITGVGGGVTVSSNTGQRIDISVAAPVAQTNQAGSIYAIGNTTSSSSGTYDARTLSISGAGIISVAATNSGWKISATESVQTQNLHNVTLSGNTAGAMAQISSGTMTLAGGNNITLSQAGNAVTISGGAGGGFSAGVSNVGNTLGDTGVSGTRMVLAGIGEVTLSQSTNANGNTVSISAPAQTVESQSIGASNLGNTLGTSGVASGGQVRAVIIGTSNITVSQSVNGASATLSLIGQPAFSAGVSTIGNTGGATGVSGTRLVLVGSNNVTLSQTTDANGATVSLFGQAPAGGAFSAGASNLGNTAGNTGITGTQLVLVGTNAISLSQTTGANGGTLSIDAPATSSLVGASGISISTNGSTISVMQTTGSAYLTSLAPYDESPMVTGDQGNATLHIQPARFPEGVQYDRFGLAMQISNATNSSNSITISAWVGLYTRNASTISLFGSTSVTTNFTGSGTVGSYSLYGGPKWMTIPWTTTVPEGDYYVGINVRSTTGGGAGHIVSQLLLSKFTNTAWSGVIGVGSAATAQRLLGQGVYTVSTAGMPNSIGFTQINGSGSLVLRSPIWMVRSGTV